MYEDLPHATTEKLLLQARIDDLRSNFEKVRKVLELAEKISTQEDIPYQLKYWF